jgi:hypothetical protein
MLAYSGKGALAIEKMDLSDLVQEMTHLLEISHTKKAEVKYSLKENLLAIEGDSYLLRQVVMNLITNASEALGDEGGTITVETGVTEATHQYLTTTYARDVLPGGALRIPGSCGYRLRHGRRGATPDVRALLHHQVHRTRARDGRDVGNCPRPQRGY